MSDDHFLAAPIAKFEENGELCELMYVPNVCIIESPSKADRAINRREGLAISEPLRVANIRHKLFDVGSRAELLNAFAEIAEFAAPVKLKPIPGELRKCCAPRLFLHFSCHGNSAGIALTDEDFITWSELGTILTTLATKLGLVDPEKCAAACMTLCMSSCCGLYGRAMANDTSAVPFLGLVGCNSTITWTESITAYNTFYHQVITKGRTIPYAVRSINDASLSREVFELVTACDVGAVGFTGDNLVVLASANDRGKLAWICDLRVGDPHIPFVWRKDQLFDPVTLEPIVDTVTGGTFEYFDDPEAAITFMQANPRRPCQVERCAAQEISIRFAHKF
ncbi:MAG: hypothetical protein K8T91_00790 [Planctomycetes bacterium]|nr:hypothetical protein [Planctomycetota bacterium]